MNRRVVVIKAMVVAVLAIPASVFAADELVLQLPVIMGKVTSFSNTCRLFSIDADNQKHELDPVTLGEAELKAGRYNINPYMRFAGAGTLFWHIDAARCIAIAGQTASERGIKQVMVTHDRSNEVTVSVPASDVDNGRSARTYTYEFTVRDGCDYSKSTCRINSTMRFRNINPRSKEWSQTAVNNMRAYF